MLHAIIHAASSLRCSAGVTHADVLLEAHKLRVERGDYAIGEEHLADAIEHLTERTTRSLSGDRGAKNPYRRRENV